MNVSPETQKTLEDAIMEIMAGNVLFCCTKEEKAWNKATERAADICRAYQSGLGITQVTAQLHVHHQHPQAPAEEAAS